MEEMRRGEKGDERSQEEGNRGARRGVGTREGEEEERRRGRGKEEEKSRGGVE